MDEVEIAVIGAAGGTGQAVVSALLRRGKSVRALIHRAEQKSIFPCIDAVPVELESVASIAKGVQGAGAVHYVPPVFHDQEEQFGINVIQALNLTGVRRMSYHSVLHSGTPGMPHHWRKARVELHLRHSDLRWTILQPAMYVQTPFAFYIPEQKVMSPGFSITKPFAPVDLDDIAEVTATVLSEEGHDYATYELAGPELLSFIDMANSLTRVTGEVVQAVQADPAVVLSMVEGRGITGNAAELLRLMMAHYDAYGLVGNSNVLEMLLKRPASRFEIVAQRLLGAA